MLSFSPAPPTPAYRESALVPSTAPNDPALDALDTLLAERPGALGDLLAPGFVVPRYDGRSIANVPATVGALLGAAIGELPTVPEPLWHPLSTGGVDRVVLLVVDALGYERLARSLRADDAAGGGTAGEAAAAGTAPRRGEPSDRAWLAERGAILAPLTAVFPSTTAATIATLWTGRTPIGHGIVGYQLWLREVGMVANMLRLRGAHRPAAIVDLVRSGAIQPRKIIPGRGVIEQLARQNLRCVHLLGLGIKDSGLSTMLFRTPEAIRGYASIGDSLTMLRDTMESMAGQRGLIAAYWDGFDLLQHERGPDSESFDDEWAMLFGALRRRVFDRLTDAARLRTVVVLVADHGQTATPPSACVHLSEHPQLAATLTLPLSGEARARYLHVRHGALADARAYAHERLGHAFQVIDTDEALAAGLWGPEPAHPEARHRLGDLVLLAHGGHTLMPEPETQRPLGRHGSLTVGEAVVPWLGWRLG